MVTIDVKIGNIEIDRIEITNTGEKLYGATLYKVRSMKHGPFFVQHHPRAGLGVLISHVFSHYAMSESCGDTPTTEEEW